jgi:hypothetical protein
VARTKAEENALADRGCAKEAAELLREINARRHSGTDTLRLLLRAREAVDDLVSALTEEK